MNQIVQTMFEPGSIEPVIIVCKSTESIELRTVAIGDNCLVAILQTVDTSGLRIKYGFKVSSFYKDTLRILVQHESIQFSCTGCHLTDGWAVCSLLQQNLFLCHREAFGSPGSLTFQYELDFYKVLCIFFKRGIIIRKRNLHALPWSYVNIHRLTCLYRFTIFIE